MTVKNKVKIIPTVFATSKREFDERFKKLNKISRNLQIDFMDGKLVRTKSIELKDVLSLKGKGVFEAHLMVDNPESWIVDLSKKGFKKVLFHYESLRTHTQISNLVFRIKGNGMKPWIVFNPETDFRHILTIIDDVSDIEGIMFMGHLPGRENETIDLNVVRKIRNIKSTGRKIKIQVDGGVDDKSLPLLVKAGVDVVNVGSFIAEAKDPKKAMKELEKLA